MNYEEKYHQLKKDYNEFVYVVSHDFKAVFRKLSSLTGWLKDDLEDGDMEEVNSHIEMIQKSSKHMDGMLEGLTLLSRVDRIEDAPVKVNVSDLSQNIKKEIGSELEIVVSAEVPDLILPEVKIRTVLQALFQNSITYNSSEKKIIHITYHSEKGKAILEVSDNGDGIANPDTEQVFKLFYNEKFKTKIDSTGYGLTYARKLIESEGGFLFVGNSSSEGTTLVIELPLNAIAK